MSSAEADRYIFFFFLFFLFILCPLKKKKTTNFFLIKNYTRRLSTPSPARGYYLFRYSSEPYALTLSYFPRSRKADKVQHLRVERSGEDYYFQGEKGASSKKLLELLEKKKETKKLRRPCLNGSQFIVVKEGEYL